MPQSMEEIKERVRKTPYVERLKIAQGMISQMCSEKRPPLMSIPAS